MIDKQITVAVPPERAFAVWTERTHLWWPPGHTPSGDPMGRVQFETQPGGRFFERCSDGREVELGRILDWEPPHRLRFAFFLGSGPRRPSEVEVRFEPLGDGTRVTVHQALGSLDEAGFERLAHAFERNWTLITRRFADHVATRETP